MNNEAIYGSVDQSSPYNPRNWSARDWKNLGAMGAGAAALGTGIAMRKASLPTRALLAGAGAGALGYGIYDDYQAIKDLERQSATKTAADKDNQFYSNRLSRDVGMSVGLNFASNLARPASPAVAAGLKLLSGGYGVRGVYDAYKQYATRPEKTASVLETFVATIR